MTVDGNKKGSMDNIVTALSGEFGWRFDLSKSFYLEPQVELAYTHVDADVLSLSDGSTYRFDDADSLDVRALPSACAVLKTGTRLICASPQCMSFWATTPL